MIDDACPQYASDGLITLTDFTVGDAQAIADGDLDVEHQRRFEAPDDFQPSLAHALAVIATWRADRASHMRYTYAVRDARAHTLLGGCELQPLGDREAALSFWTYAGYRGRGIAGRAVALALEMVRAIHEFDRIIAQVDRDNFASRAVLVGNGFVQVEGAGARNQFIFTANQSNPRG
jgi:[ribosomal protein S5]-alanine N-acetyltransferase